MIEDNLSDGLIIAQTKKWLETVIVDHNLCPFARPVLTQDSIHYAVIRSEDIAECLESLILECEQLDANKKIETTLLIFPEGFANFEDFLDLLEIANDLLVAQSYEGIYQLASFHPDYRFADAEKGDPANYTNRSPYPMLHLIREKSIERVLMSYPQPENIPQRNIDLARQLGENKMKALLAACFHPNKKTTK